MKKIIFLLFISATCHGQYVAISNQMFGTGAELRLHPGAGGVQVQLNGVATYNDGLGGAFIWDSTSTATDDTLNVFKVATITTGRWVRLQNANSIKKSATFSAITLQTSYTITHGLGYIPAMIIIQPRSVTAAALSYISAITSTTFTVNFITAPVAGTNNLTFDYIIIKH